MKGVLVSCSSRMLDRPRVGALCHLLVKDPSRCWSTPHTHVRIYESILINASWLVCLNAFHSQQSVAAVAVSMVTAAVCQVHPGRLQQSVGAAAVCQGDRTPTLTRQWHRHWQAFCDSWLGGPLPDPCHWCLALPGLTLQGRGSWDPPLKGGS